MADVKPNIKPTVTADGHEVFDIPVEEEELEVANSMGQSKIWAMKVSRGAAPCCARHAPHQQR